MTDSEKLRVLADWFDIHDEHRQLKGQEVQIDLHRIADRLEKEEWISVDDRLPEDAFDVLCCDHNDTIIVGYYDKDYHWLLRNGESILFVTHWQPLPEPPKTK